MADDFDVEAMLEAPYKKEGLMKQAVGHLLHLMAAALGADFLPADLSLSITGSQ